VSANAAGGPPALREREHPKAPRLALDVTEACEALGVSWPTWREHIEPEVKIVRVGRRKLVAVAELERWLADRGERIIEDRS
jgi:hypothetical protein